MAFAFAALVATLNGCQQSDGWAQATAPAPDGYSWTQIAEHAAYPVGYNFPVFVAKGRMWAFHPEGVWDSLDGRTWTRSQLPPIRPDVYRTQYVQFRDAIYALGDNAGNYERIKFSPRVRRTIDFRRWEEVVGRSNLPGRIFNGLTVFDNKMWLLGGYDGKSYHNDVWNSADGVTWTVVAKNAAWSPRTGSTVAVLEGKMYLIGGGVIDGMTNANPQSEREIWSSANGTDWTRVDTDLQNRAGGFPVVFDDKLWLVGANRDGTFARSSLVSGDGAKWQEVAAPWSPRGGSAAWVFEGKLYMTGGKYSVTENGQITFIYSNDVWVMEKK